MFSLSVRGAWRRTLHCHCETRLRVVAISFIIHCHCETRLRVVAISREGGLLLSSYSRTPNNGTAAVELRSPSQRQKKPSRCACHLSRFIGRAYSRQGELLHSSYSRTPNKGTSAVELRSPSQRQKKICHCERSDATLV